MAINKIVLNTESGEQVLVDLTGDNVTADKMLQGATAHDKSGENISGTIESFDGSYECSGESTGGGGTTEVWHGIVESIGSATLGSHFILHYIDENGEYQCHQINQHESKEITLCSNAMILILTESGLLETEYSLAVRQLFNIGTTMLFQPTADNFHIGIN